MASASAWSTSALVAPDASRSAATACPFLIRPPTTPTVTSFRSVVSGAPPAPRIGARAGQSRATANRSPACSAGLIVAGVHATSQWPLWLIRWTVVAVSQSPGASANRWPTRTAAREPDCLIRPGMNVAEVAPSADSAAALTVVKSDGGVSTWARIAA